MSATDEIKQIYDKTGNDPKAWFRHAEELLISHSILYDEYKQVDYTKLGNEGLVPDEGRILMPTLMLLAFAIECLLKALWLKQGNRLAENGELKKIPNCGDHNLVEYGNATGLIFGDDEKRVLNRLYKISVSLGRYPIPIGFRHSHLRKTRKTGFQSDISWGFTDDVIVDRIIRKINKKAATYQ